MRSTIRVTNLNKRFGIDIPRVQDAARKIVRRLGKREWYLELVFVDDDRMRILNRKYKKVNRATDVLSFDIGGDPGFGVDDFSGCVFISSDKALTNSFRFDTVLTNEILLYIIHGILHLAGYDDMTPRDRQRMSKKESEVLDYLRRKGSLGEIVKTSPKKR